MSVRINIATTLVILCIPLGYATMSAAQATQGKPHATPPKPQASPVKAQALPPKSQDGDFEMDGQWVLSYYRVGINGTKGFPCTYQVTIKKIKPDPRGPFFYPYPTTDDPNGAIATAYYFTGTYADSDPAVADHTKRNNVDYPCYNSVMEPGSVGNYSPGTVFVGWLGIARPTHAPVGRSGVMIMTEVSSSKAEAGTSKGFLAAYEGAFHVGGDQPVIQGQRSEPTLPCVLTPGEAQCGAVQFTLECVSGTCSTTWSH